MRRRVGPEGQRARARALRRSRGVRLGADGARVGTGRRCCSCRISRCCSCRSCRSGPGRSSRCRRSTPSGTISRSCRTRSGSGRCSTASGWPRWPRPPRWPSRWSAADPRASAAGCAGGRLIESLLALPWAVPGTVFAIALATAFSVRAPWAGRVMLVGTVWILPLAYLVRNLPITSRAILAGFRGARSVARRGRGHRWAPAGAGRFAGSPCRSCGPPCWRAPASPS